ncbi:hypothetical protein PMAYCL1PPCAC_08033, partial [Pristionchus mayeri]
DLFRLIKICMLSNTESINKLKHGYIIWDFSPWRDYAETKNETIANIGAQVPEKIDSLISDLENTDLNISANENGQFYVLKKAIENLVFQIRGRELRKNGCVLEMNWNWYYQRRGPFLKVIDTLVNMILQLEIMLTTYAHLYYDGCSSCSNRDFIDLPGSVTSVSTYVEEWLDKAQEISFPRIGIEAVKQDIGTKEIHFSDYNTRAELIHRLFEERGGFEKSHHVLIVPTEDEIHYVVENNSTKYANFTISGGSTAHIFQFDSKDDSSNVEKARGWI